VARRRLDVVPLVAAVLVLATAVLYVGIIRAQSDQPAWWFLTALVLGAGAAAYGASAAAPHRRTALLVAGLLLVPMGVLGILSIGLPVLLAGALCLAAAARVTPTPIS
jgi:hypothetical protein